MEKIICIGYILFVTGMAVSSVGEIPEGHQEPYPWWLPLVVFVFMAVPSWFAYLAGLSDK